MLKMVPVFRQCDIKGMVCLYLITFYFHTFLQIFQYNFPTNVLLYTHMAGMPQEVHAIMVNVTETCLLLQASNRQVIARDLFFMQRMLAVRSLSKK